MMRVGFMIGLLAMAAGCPPTPGQSTDAHVDDGASGGARLVLSVHADIESSSLDELKQATLVGISRIALQLEDVRVIGDAAPGDARTTLAEVEFDFSSSDKECLSFEGVPPGIYSRVLARVVQYRIEGSVEDNGVEYSFRIEDTPPFALSAMVDVEDVLVDVEEDGEIGVELAPEPLIGAVDWEAHQPDGNGHFDIDSTSPSIDEVRDALLTLMQAHDPSASDECAAAL